jgi:hypothetical protein
VSSTSILPLVIKIIHAITAMESHQKILTQIEYYLSDKNLVKDKFFREQIQTSKDGYIDISHFLNCNNVKKEKWTIQDIK